MLHGEDVQVFVSGFVYLPETLLLPALLPLVMKLSQLVIGGAWERRGIVLKEYRDQFGH